MWILVKNADSVVEVYRRVAELEGEVKNLINDRTECMLLVDKLNGRIAVLELENETLQREVDHWKAEYSLKKNEQSARQTTR